MLNKTSPFAVPNDEFFRALEVQRTRSLVERDLQMFERLHADEYHLVTPVGKVFTRKVYMDAIKAKPFYTAWQVLGEMLVRRSEAMAVVRYMARLELWSGQTIVCWHMDTYELYKVGWQAVWSQATELSPLLSPS